MMEGSFSNPGYHSLDLIEEGRREIFKWRERRQNKRSGLHGTFYKITKLFITRSLVRSFLHNLSVVVMFQMILAAICTYSCVKIGLEMDVHMSLFVSPIVFPLAFSINANYQRRETVLEDLAMFKSASSILFFCHRDWIKAAELPVDLLKTLSNKLKFLVINIREYLLTDKWQKRKFILQAIYEDFSDIAQLNDKIRTSSLKSNSALCARIIHCHNLMCWAFERLRVIREYNSPRSLRAFTKVFIFLMPLLLSPYYVHSGRQTESAWAPYYISVMVSFLFGSLQAVQDKLDDPFDGIGEDDVNLTQLDDWTTQSLLTNRTVKVGRFTVTTTTGQDQSSKTSQVDQVPPDGSPKKLRSFNFNSDNGSSPKLRRILSLHKNERHSDGRTSIVSGLDESQFTDQLEARCHGITSRLEGLSGTSQVLPSNRVPYVYQDLKSEELSSIETLAGNAANVFEAIAVGSNEKKISQVDNRLAVVHEDEEERSSSPVSEDMLLQMRSDKVIRPEESSKNERPTVLGLFSQGNTQESKVSDHVYTSSEKTDTTPSNENVLLLDSKISKSAPASVASALDSDAEQTSCSTPKQSDEVLPLLNKSTLEASPTLESGSETGKTLSSAPEDALESEVTNERQEVVASQSETEGTQKLRFCLPGKRGAKLWSRKKHKKKAPVSSAEPDVELTTANSMSPLLLNETRSVETKTGGVGELGQGDEDSPLLPFKDADNIVAEQKDTSEIAVQNEEESSLWDFNISLDKPEVEDNFSERTQSNEELSPLCKSNEKSKGNPNSSGPGESNLISITDGPKSSPPHPPDSKNRNVSDNLKVSKPACSEISSGSRFVVSVKDSENTGNSPSSSEISAEQEGSRFSVSRNDPTSENPSSSRFTVS